MEQTPRPPHRPAGLPPSMRRPSPQPAATGAAPARPVRQESRSRLEKPTAPKSKKSFTFAAIAIGAVCVLIIAAALTMGIGKLMASGEVKTGKDQYQAVFLSNNMVYFGKLSNINGEYVKLADIYYLQVQPQQNNQNQSQNQQPQSQLSLAKLGSELHGPEDVMYINRKEIMFWENLKTDGKVVEAIKNYKAGQK